MASLKNLWQITKAAFSKDVFGQGMSDFFGKIGNAFSNWSKQTFGTGVTDRERELNAMNMQNVEDTAARQVSGYEKAGINPALMFGGSGSSNSAPQTTAAPGNSNLSELMQAIMLPAQLRMLKAQTGQVEAQTAKTMADTEQIKQIVEYYPQLTEKTIAEIASRADINLANVRLTDVKTEAEKVQKILADKENKYADLYFKARAEYEEAHTEEAKKSAAEKGAAALMTGFELQYAKSHNAKLSSSSILALASAIFKGFEGLTDSISSAVADVLGSDPTEYDGHDLNHTGFKLFGDIGRRLAAGKTGGSR